MTSNLQVSSHRVSAHVTTAVSHMLSPTHDFSGSSGGGGGGGGGQCVEEL